MQKKNNRKYYYRAKSLRKGSKIRKERIYLGVNLKEEELKSKEKQADKKLSPLKINKKLEKIKPKIKEILKKNNIKKAGIFGSYAKGEQRKDSDVDILIEFDGSLLDLVGLEIELKKKLRKKIDLITYGGINHLLRERILNEEVRII
ncbi:MAG: nucleotidyltransferase family protein [Nanoarchaeota archaeon]|nr:nucleotidyltransferase family protein [Nanoarchaeota archaeon]